MDHNSHLHPLKTLVNARVSFLARKLGGRVRKQNAVPARKPAGGIVNDALTKLIQKEVLSGLATVFSGQSRDRQQGRILGPADGGGMPVPARQAPGGIDQKKMEATIDQIVATALMQGRQTSGILRTLFGLVPSLIGR